MRDRNMAEEVFEALMDEDFLKPLNEPAQSFEDVEVEFTELDLIMDASFAQL